MKKNDYPSLVLHKELLDINNSKQITNVTIHERELKKANFVKKAAQSHNNKNFQKVCQGKYW